MPRLLINGFPETNKAIIHIRLNGAAKGSGNQSHLLFDKTINPVNGIFEIPVEKQYLGSSIRLEVSIPGFKIIDRNVLLQTNKGYTSIKLVKKEEPDLSEIESCYVSLDDWKSIDTDQLHQDSKRQFKTIIKKEQKLERNTTMAAIAIVLLFATLLYIFTGPFGVLVLLCFAFYYREKNKTNRWSDLTK